MRLVQNMAYRVIITPPAKRRLDRYIGYTTTHLKNRTAAAGIRKDAEETKNCINWDTANRYDWLYFFMVCYFIK